MLAGQQVLMYNVNYDKETYIEQVEVSDDAELSITIQPKGGFVLTDKL